MQILEKIKKRYKNDGFKAGMLHFASYLIIPFKKLLNIFTTFIINQEKKLSIKDMIVLECESDMDDNPRAIYECLLKKGWNKSHKIIWLVQDVKHCRILYKEKNVIFINRFNNSNLNKLKLTYYLSRARWFVFSHPYWFYKYKKEQIVINTDHGSTINKKTEKGKVLNRAKCCFDWILVPTEFSKEATYNFWPCQYEQMFLCGRPANDFLFKSEFVNIKSIVPNYVNGDKIIICMPTYKESSSSNDNNLEEKYLIDVVQNKDQMNELNSFLNKTRVHFILKAHPMQITSKIQSQDYSNIHYIFNKDLLFNRIILYELIGCSDALITDLSSVYIDYLMLNRPLGFFMYSVKNYSRGFNIDNFEEYLPGEKIYSLDDLIRFVKNVCCNNDAYEDERMRINGILNPPKDNYSEILLKRFEII